jgi:flagellar motor protein MotB
MAGNDAHHEEGKGGSHGGGGHGPRGGGHEEAHEGAPEWLISFADNVMLLMGFFVILLAMNMIPKGKGSIDGDGNTDPDAQVEMLDFIIGMREAFNNKVDLDSKNPTDAPLIRRMLQRTSGKTFEDGPQGTSDGLQAIRPSDYNQITASVPFDNESSDISAEARATLAQAAESLRDQRWMIEVRGHVSPFESMRNPVRAMELSHQRGVAAARVLVENGVAWRNLRIVSCGDNDRVVARTFDRDQDRANQRVELVVTNDVAPGGEAGAARPGSAAAGGGD